MNNSLRFAAFALLLAFAHQSKADTVLSVTNGSGGYAPNLLSFYDANGTQLVLDGGSGVVTITYPDSKVFSFPYSQTVAGLSVTGSWSGTDEWGYDYTATVQETLVQTRHGLSGRGGGYKTVTVTSVSGGKIIYD